MSDVVSVEMVTRALLMALGVQAEETDPVLEILRNRPIPSSPAGVLLDIDAAVLQHRRSS